MTHTLQSAPLPDKKHPPVAIQLGQSYTALHTKLITGWIASLRTNTGARVRQFARRAWTWWGSRAVRPGGDSGQGHTTMISSHISPIWWKHGSTNWPVECPGKPVMVTPLRCVIWVWQPGWGVCRGVCRGRGRGRGRGGRHGFTLAYPLYVILGGTQTHTLTTTSLLSTHNLLMDKALY